MREIPQIAADITASVSTPFHTSSEHSHLSRKQISHFSELLEALAAQQVSLSLQAEELTKKNLNLQAKVVKLTWALFWLTLLLALVSAIQVYFLFSNRP